ncbi:hypothetical protein GC177_04900 [bacterium]|nr:hypothetical protein [bacterium]
MYQIPDHSNIVLYLDSCVLSPGCVQEALAFRKLINEGTGHHVDIVLIPEVVREMRAFSKNLYINSIIDEVIQTLLQSNSRHLPVIPWIGDVFERHEDEWRQVLREIMNEYFTAHDQPTIKRTNAGYQRFETDERLRQYVYEHPRMADLRQFISDNIYQTALRKAVAHDDIIMMDSQHATDSIADIRFKHYFSSDRDHNIGLLLTRDTGNKDGAGALAFTLKSDVFGRKICFNVEPGAITATLNELCELLECVDNRDSHLAQLCNEALQDLSKHPLEARDLFGHKACGFYDFSQFASDHLWGPAVSGL